MAGIERRFRMNGEGDDAARVSRVEGRLRRGRGGRIGLGMDRLMRHRDGRLFPGLYVRAMNLHVFPAKH